MVANNKGKTRFGKKKVSLGCEPVIIFAHLIIYFGPFF